MNKRTLVFLVCFILCVCMAAYGEVSGILSGKDRPAADQGAGQTGLSTPDQLMVENPVPAESIMTPEPELELLDPEVQVMMGCTFRPVDDDHAANHELQTYVIPQATVEGNHLRMEAVPNGAGYLSGKVETDNSFRYGEFAFRVNRLTGKGLFPAIWMLPTEGTEYPEVDIYEVIGSRPHEVYGVLHFLKEGKKDRDYFTYHYDREAVPESYVIGFTWDRDEMVWYLDGQPVYTIRENVPDMPMFMIANLAVGGIWPGAPDKATQFPAAFEVEVLKFEPQEIYVR